MPLVLGVDSSTGSTKVEVRDADDGTLVASGRAPHPAAEPPRSEQEAGAWWDALIAAIGQTGVRDIAALSVAAQQHGMVVLDGAGAVLRPAKLWNDTESAPQAAAISSQLGAERLARAVGSVPLAPFTLTKLAWLAKHQPRLYERVSMVLLPHDYLTFRLTGRFVTDRGDASGTGYWSPAEGRWRTDVIDQAVGRHPGGGWAERLPEVLGPLDPSDWMSASVHEVLGLRGRPLCGPGTGDSMAAALAVGLGPGETAMSLGNSGTVFCVAEQPSADPSGRIAGFADATGRFLPLVCTLNATRVTDAIARLLGVGTPELAELALRTRSSGGLVLLPYLDGERAPRRPDASGQLVGLRTSVERAELARAAFEGVICNLLDGLGALERAGFSNGGPITLLGGGASSAAYRQILADLSGRTVTVPALAESVATGACVQAAAVLHGRAPDEIAAQWNSRRGVEIEPDPRVDAAEVRAAFSAARAGLAPG